MNQSNAFALLSFLFVFASCKNTKYLSKEYGEITSEDIVRIEYYEGKNFRSSNSHKIPNSTISDKLKIAEITHEINTANKPAPWKGAHWDKILIIKKDTVLTFSTNGKIIGVNHSSGTFYQFRDEGFIERYFED